MYLFWITVFAFVYFSFLWHQKSREKFIVSETTNCLRTRSLSRGCQWFILRVATAWQNTGNNQRGTSEEEENKGIKEQLSELPGWTSDTCCSSSAGKLWICWEEKMSSEGKTTGWVFLTLLVFLILLTRIALFSLLISNRYLPPTFFLLLIFKTKNTTEFMTGTGLRPGRTVCSPYPLTALCVAWRWAVCHPFPRRLQRNADSGLSFPKAIVLLQ